VNAGNAPLLTIDQIIDLFSDDTVQVIIDPQSLAGRSIVFHMNRLKSSDEQEEMNKNRADDCVERY
jgi:hypothetical protein